MSFCRRFPAGQTAGKTCVPAAAASRAGGQGEGSRPHGKRTCLLVEEGGEALNDVMKAPDVSSRNEQGLAKPFKGAFPPHSIPVALGVT